MCYYNIWSFSLFNIVTLDCVLSPLMRVFDVSSGCSTWMFSSVLLSEIAEAFLNFFLNKLVASSRLLLSDKLKSFWLYISLKISGAPELIFMFFNDFTEFLFLLRKSCYSWFKSCLESLNCDACPLSTGLIMSWYSSSWLFFESSVWTPSSQFWTKRSYWTKF